MKFAVLAISLLGVAASASAAATGNDFVSFISDERGTPMAHVAVSMAKLFPTAAIANLTGFDLDVGYTNYNTTLFQKIANDLGNTKGTLESKAGAVVSALYGKEFTFGDDSEMDEDYSRLATVAHPNFSLQARGFPYITWATSNAIKLTTCAGFFSCISGQSCQFYVTVKHAPRSRCESQGGENCCMSWANFDVQAGFFKATWTSCFNRRPHDKESCEGHDNHSGNGGNVCFSNRSKGCT